jgi:hypothetical protein
VPTKPFSHKRTKNGKGTGLRSQAGQRLTARPERTAACGGLKPLSVMNPTAETGGLQVTRNDNMPASGRMTSARRRLEGPAACASSEAHGHQVPPAQFPAGNRHGAVGAVLVLVNRGPQRAGVPEHTGSLVHTGGRRLPHASKRGPPRRKNGEYGAISARGHCNTNEPA